MSLFKDTLPIEEKFYNLLNPIVNENGFMIYDLTYISGQNLLRLFIFDETSNTAELQDCVKIDQALSHIFDEGWVPDDIVLEVSSPGVFRELSTDWHYQKAIDERVSLKLKAPLEDLNETDSVFKKQYKLDGILKGHRENVLLLEIDEAKIVEISADNIKKAQLAPIF